MPKLRVDKDGMAFRHKKIYKLFAEGKNAREIADTLDMDYTHITTVLNKPAFLAATAKLYDTAATAARAIFEKNAVEAAKKIVKISMHGKPDNRVQLDASKEILYQIGLKPVEVIETRGREYTPEEIQSSLTVIKEVQAIEEKMASQGSGFLIKQEANEPYTAPVDAGSAEITEEVKVV